MKYINQIFSIILFFFMVSFTASDPYSIKRISDKDFRYEFYTTSKRPSPKLNRDYFWFKGGIVHHAQSGIAGELLHGKFVKYYHSNQLAEQGNFKKGLKVNEWKTWFENGKLSSIQHWSSGVMHGRWTYYDQQGNIVEKGKFCKGLKVGKWINYERKDTISYKKGQVFVSKVKKKKVAEPEKIPANMPEAKEKKSFFKRLFSKKAKATTNHAQGA